MPVVDYCTIADVKPVLHIDLAETSEDAELANCVTSGSALVDGLLKVNGLTVPVAVPVPQLVKDAAKFFAAWEYRRRREPDEAEAFWNDAQRFLQAYIDAETEPYVGSA
jgi:hypothetical protein